nr:hypothetical protein [Tanacetum cinerariifolium]
MLNPISGTGVESIFAIASSLVAPPPTPTPTMIPSTITTITTATQAPIPPTPIPSEVLQNLPTFDSVFRFNERLKSLEASFSEYADRFTIGSKSRHVSANESAFAEEPVLTTSQIEEPTHPVFETGAEDQPIFQTSQHHEWFSPPKKPPTPDRDWNKTLP